VTITIELWKERLNRESTIPPNINKTNKDVSPQTIDNYKDRELWPCSRSWYGTGKRVEGLGKPFNVIPQPADDMISKDKTLQK
jgi:hypothetical protein